MSMTIRTNNVPRDVLNAWELTPKERAEFDYLDWGAIEEGSDSASFVRYRGELYDLGEFIRIEPMGSSHIGPMGCSYNMMERDNVLASWDGIRTDSFFSGLVLRWAKDECGRLDCERVVIGLAMS